MYLTVHLSSGLSALKILKKVSKNIKIAGVTTLTSLNDKDLKEIGLFRYRKFGEAHGYSPSVFKKIQSMGKNDNKLNDLKFDKMKTRNDSSFVSENERNKLYSYFTKNIPGGIPGKVFDTISLQYSIHYFFDSKR